MRSVVALAALALAGTFDSVVAVDQQQCTGGTRPPLTSWMSDHTKTTISSNTQTSLSGSIETSQSVTVNPSSSGSLSMTFSDSALTGSQTSVAPTDSKTDGQTNGGSTGTKSDVSLTTSYTQPTVTVSTSTSTATDGPRVIKNEVSNGNFAKSNPDGSIPAWDVQGDVQVIVGPGYTGDGSHEKGCAGLKASDAGSGGLEKRDLGPFAGLSQNIFNLNTQTLYTVRFFFLVITAPTQGFNICQLNAYLGSRNFYQEWIFSMGSSIQWNTVLTQVPAVAAFAPIGISVNCFSGGLAFVYVDSVFMSNMVTPANINDFNLDFGDGDDTGSTTTSATTSRIAGSTSASATASGSATTSSAASLTGSAASGSSATQTGSAASGSSSTVTGSAASGSSTVTGSGASRPPTQTGSVASGSTTSGTASSSGLQTGSSVSSSGSTSTQSQVSQQTGTSTGNAGQSGSSTQTSATQSSTQTPAQSVSRICANVGNSPIDGRLCGVYKYQPANVYRILPTGPIQKEECAAVCLSDSKCQSFYWRDNGGCANECQLSTSELRQDNVGTLGSNVAAYDRSCAWTIPCFQYPDGSLCLNRIGDTPAPGCSSKRGSLKSCAQVMLSFTVNPCGSTDQCRSQCLQYKGCKSFSVTNLELQNNCKLYSGTVDEIVDDTTGNLYFQDLSCFACGENMGWSTYAYYANDVYSIPVNSCAAPSTTASVVTSGSASGSGAQSTLTNSSPPSGSSLPPTPTVSDQTTTTTSGGGSSTDLIQCARYFAPPGFCSGLAYPPPPTTDIEGTKGTTNQPQRVCNAHGMKRGTFTTVDRSIYPHQDSGSDCALLCYRQSNCKSFGLSNPDPVTGARHCLLSENMIAYDGFNVNTDDAIYWADDSCYDCVKCDIPWGAQTTSSAGTSSNSATQSTSTGASSTGSSPNGGSSTSIPSTGITTTGTASTTATSSSASTTATSSDYDCPLALEQGCTWNRNYAVNSTMTCQRNGRFQPPDTFYLGGDYPQQMHRELCSALCAEFSTSCKASAWDDERSRCIFAYHSISDLSYFEPAAFNPPTASYLWTDQSCIQCPCDSSASATTSSSTSTTTSSDAIGATPFDADPALTPEYCQNPIRTPDTEGRPCGLYARTSVAPYSGDDALNPDDCGMLCLASNVCQSFSWNEETNACYIFQEKPSDLSLVEDRNAYTMFYDRACYQCPQMI